MSDTQIQDFEAALTLQRKGDAAGAEAAYKKLLATAPEHADALNNLALLRKQAGDKAEAEALYRRSLAVRPDNPEVCSNLGVLLLETGRLAEAEATLRQAIALRPAYAEAWNNLGNVFQGMRRYDEALAAYGEILGHLPAKLRQVGEAAGQAHAAGHAAEAARLAGQARGLRATIVESCWNLSLLHLLLGRYAEGWPLHEARYDAARIRPVAVPPGLPCPQWKGEPLAGKAILVWFEQGFGDEIQFARYIPWLKAQGARQVTLVCKPPLVELLRTVPGVDGVFAAEGEHLVVPAQDYWVLPMSLALHHKTTLETIPTPLPYVQALPERLAAWAPRLPGEGFRVGVVWAGSASHRNDSNRSLPSADLLAPLAAIPGVSFVSLQKGEREGEALPASMDACRLGPDLADFADTAAVVAQLDLVITVDTAVAHVAGALGKPCWVLIPWLGVDWRWLLEREDSPWYPGALRLFRQAAEGGWPAVISRVAEALAAQLPVAPSAGKADEKVGAGSAGKSGGTAADKTAGNAVAKAEPKTPEKAAAKPAAKAGARKKKTRK